MYKNVKSVILKLLKTHGGLTAFLCRVLNLLGLSNLSSKVALRTGHIPDVVNINVSHAGVYRAPFKMYSHSGKDLVVAEIWASGWDKFEQPLPRVMAAFAEICEGTFLDVGANTGFYSFLLQTVNPRLSVHLFEPYPPALNLLSSNLRLNNLYVEGGSRLKIFDYAVGEENGRARLYVPLQDHGLVESSCSLDSEFKDSHSAIIEVDVRTLDSHAADYQIGDVAMIKIDVEGFESSVLAGSKAVIESCRPVIFIEILKNAKVDFIEEIRDRSNYLTFRLAAPSQIIDEPKVGFDNNSWNHLMVPREKAYLVEQVKKQLR
mgnify:CR=1 FL=1